MSNTSTDEAMSDSSVSNTSTDEAMSDSSGSSISTDEGFCDVEPMLGVKCNQIVLEEIPSYLDLEAWSEVETLDDIEANNAKVSKFGKSGMLKAGKPEAEQDTPYVKITDGLREGEPPERHEMDKLISILRKLNGFIPKDEANYYEDELDQPVYLNDRDKEGCFVSQSVIQTRLKEWRDAKRETAKAQGRSFTEEEQRQWDLSEEAARQLIEYKLKIAKQKKAKEAVKPIPEKDITKEISANRAGVLKEMNGKKVISYSRNRSSLPYLNARIRQSSHTTRELDTAILIDSGATCCMMGVDMFKALGLSKKHLANQGCYTLNSATERGSNKALGDIDLDLYLQGADGEYYGFRRTFVILNSEVECILGWRDLTELKFRWKQLANGEGQKLELQCSKAPPHLAQTGEFTAQFITKSLQKTQTMVNLTDIQLHKAETVNIVLGSEDMIRTRTGYMSLQNEGLVIPEVEVNQLTYQRRKVLKSRWPKPAVDNYKLEVSGIAKRDGCIPIGALKVKLYPIPDEEELEEIDTDIQAYLSRTDLELKYQKGHNEGEPATFIPDVDEMMLNSVYMDSYAVETEGKPDKNKVLTEADVTEGINKLAANIKNEAARKELVDIINKRRNTISRHKHDIGKCRHVPKVKLELMPGAKLWNDKPRRYTTQDVQIINDSVKDMETAGVIERVPDGVNPKVSSSLHLVAKKDEDTTLIERGKADQKIKLKDMKSKRVCVDLRNMNKNIMSSGAMYLPRLEEVLPNLYGAHVSSFDVKSAFWTVEYDEESRNYTTFINPYDSRQYRFKRLVMGCKNSPADWQRILGIILSEVSFERFKNSSHYKELMKTEPEFKNLRLPACCLWYLDDILIYHKNIKIHNFLVDYVLNQMEYHNVKWDTHKAHVLRPTVTFLGHEINIETGEYYLGEDRIQAFKKWSVPSNRQALVSRLACLSYFSKMTPGLKVLAAPLFILARSKKEFKFLPLHYRSWEETKYMLCLNLRQRLIDVNKPLLLTTDASWMSVSGNAFQIEDGQLRLVASYSKLLPVTDLLKSTVWKEGIGITSTMSTFEPYIRANKGIVVVMTDSASLMFLRRQKEINSRIYRFGQYVCGFGNVAMAHIEGKGNFISDALSRQYGSVKARLPAAMNKEQMEKYPKLEMKQWDTIYPDTLAEVILGKVEEYVAPNKLIKTVYDPQTDIPALEKIFAHSVTEQAVFDAATKGFSAVDPNHWLWQKESKKKDKIFSEAEFKAYYDKHKLGELKTAYGKAETAANWIEVVCNNIELAHEPESWTNKTDKVKCDKAFLQFARQLAQKGKHVANQKTSKTEEYQDELKALIAMANSYINKPENRNITSITQLLEGYRDSILCEKEQGEQLRTARIVPIYIPDESEVSVSNDGCIGFQLKKPVTLKPGESVRINMACKIASVYAHHGKPILSKGLMGYLDSNDLAGKYYFEAFYIHNHSTQTQKVSGTVLQLVSHYTDNGRETCDHGEAQDLVPVVLPGDAELVAMLKEDSKFTQVNQAEVRVLQDADFIVATAQAYMDMAKETPWSVQALVSEAEKTGLNMDQWSTEGNAPDISTETSTKGQRKKKKMDRIASVRKLTPNQKAMLNKNIMLSKLLKNGNIMNPKHLAELQNSCTSIKQLVLRVNKNEGMAKYYVINKGVLFKIEMCPFTGTDYLRIVLPDYLAIEILYSMHHKFHMHSSSEAIKQMFNNYYTLVPRKHSDNSLDAMIRDIQVNCVVCTHNQQCIRHRHIGTARTVQTSKPGTAYAADLLENLPRDKMGYKYCLVMVCLASGFTVIHPMKTRKSSELIRALRFIMPYIGNNMEHLETDAASLFRSEMFRNWCLTNNIELRRPGAVKRSQSNRAEEYIKLTRNALTNLLMEGLLEDRMTWSDYIPLCMQTINNIPVLYKLNKLTRTQLFFGSDRPSSLLTSRPARDVYLKELMKHRVDKAKTAYGAKELHNKYRVNDVVKITKSKSEHDSLEGATGLQPSSAELARVDEPTEAGAKVTLLRDGAKMNVGIARMEPCDLGETHRMTMSNEAAYDLSDMAGKMPRMYQRPSLFETINDYKMDDKLLGEEDKDHEPPTDVETEEFTSSEEETDTEHFSGREEDIEAEESHRQYSESEGDTEVRRSRRVRRQPDRYQAGMHSEVKVIKSAMAPEKPKRRDTRQQVSFHTEERLLYAVTEKPGVVGTDKKDHVRLFEVHWANLDPTEEDLAGFETDPNDSRKRRLALMNDQVSRQWTSEPWHPYRAISRDRQVSR